MSEHNTVSFNVGFFRESASDLAQIHMSGEQGKKILPVKPLLEMAKSILTNAYRALSSLAKAEKEISPAAEWLIDNFYIIQEQIVQVETDFPKEYHKSIPLIGTGEYRGLPRVYEIVLNYLNHTDLVLDPDALEQYVQSYQQQITLQQGEIWAIPIMLRLILIEKLAKKASRVLFRKDVRADVAELLSSLDESRQEEPGVFSHEVSDWLKNIADSNEPLYLVELYNQLQNSGRLWDEQKRWLNFRFRQFDLTLEEAMRFEAQKQSRLQVSIQNGVSSLRKSSETDWSEFVEECSIIEKILRLDPAGIYPAMDFRTRDSYRRIVERLSRQSEFSETEVAELVLLLIEEYEEESVIRDDRLGNRKTAQLHVGYYLIDEGYRDLISKLSARIPVREKIRLKLEKQTGWYISAIIIHSVILMVLLWMVTGAMGSSPVVAALVLLVALFPSLDLSVSAVNRFFAFFLPPRILPKMDYKDDIPDESRTLVVVPTLFTSPADVRRQAENLEIRSLANPDPACQFVLLSDFTDAPDKERTGDDAILEAAQSEINRLNIKYSSRYGDKFFFLHRERLWNESEGVWMGWERKRGKLEELNRLLCNSSAKTTYTHLSGNFIESIEKQPVRYVITLDSDTKLPPDSARNLIRTIAHPLNRARYNEDKRRITAGYGIIQPRISIPPESARKTWFSRIFSGNVGLDPYSTAVSDIYQDLAGEAVFTGKGIYDVKAFHEVLDGKFPDNRILSHDLIESTYLRTGLATDIELFDDYPATYAGYSKRVHRWTRGDWQIAAWLLGRVPGRDGKEKNPINLLSKWKIFDNLRRSLNPFFLTLFFVAGWFLLPGTAWIWTVAALGILAFPIYVSLSSDILNRPARVRWTLYLDKIRSNLKTNSIQSLFVIMILPHQAYVQLDAVIRTLYRLKISEKQLLEWTTALQTEQTAANSLNAYVRGIGISIILGISILLTAVLTAPHYLWIIVPFFIMWTGAPIFLWKVSQPVKVKRPVFDVHDTKRLRIYARRTWFYFERFVNEENFWLPPDNYQEDPSIPLTQRTSPTNIGLALVSTQVAFNRGYITLGELLERVWNTLNSMEKLERYEGHFYNWYQTKLGEVLYPKYISTVDSGNLAAGLISIRGSVEKAMNSSGMYRHIWSGLEDTITTLREILCDFTSDESIHENVQKRSGLLCDSMLAKLQERDSDTAEQDLELLKSLRAEASALTSIDLLPLGSKLNDSTMQDLLYWQESPLKFIERVISEMKSLSDTEEKDLGRISPETLIYTDLGKEQKSKARKLLIKWKFMAEDIDEKADRFVKQMDFSFLYIKKRGLFSIGYNVEKAQLDPGTYDLLASEARIASYIAIAKGDIHVEHWFRLSRRLTNLNSNEILLSWGGTMFEYLMPLLFMRSYPDTLLDHTGRNVILWQQEYGSRRNMPWGYSESAYYFLNIEMHYQYRAFGAPGLGLKRGLAEEYVVAPYASMLSMMVDPVSSMKNLRALEKLGAFGLLGFYDAIDFSPSHIGKDETHKVVKTYMVHHHGMSLLAIENVLNNWEIQNYFHSDLRVKGCELILQEKIPRGVPIKEPHPIDVELEPGEQPSKQNVVEHAGINELDVSPPRLHLLSNGNYSMLLTHAGTGVSRSNDISLTGWQPDPTMDTNGLFFYIKDKESGKYWSAMHQPVRKKPDRYDTWFHNGKIVTSRVDEWIETTTSVVVSPDHPMELRKITLTNYSREERTLEITSYAEVVLNRAMDHHSHPAFSKLFLQADYLAEYHSILMKRRPRKENEKPLWMIHTFAGNDDENLSEPLQFETDRFKFVGRGRTLSEPIAMDHEHKLHGSLGNISDPIVSLRKTIRLGPGEKTEVIFGLGFAESQEEAVQLADMYDNIHAAERAFDLSSVFSSVQLNHLGLSSKEAHSYQKLASYAIYSDSAFRTDEHRLKENRKKQQDLWAYGISGDYPLIVLRIQEMDQIKRVKTLLKAHAFWRLNGVETELLLLNDHAPGYIDEVQEAILEAVNTSLGKDMLNKRGGVFIQRSDRMHTEDLTLMLTVAHIVFENKFPNLSKLYREKETESWFIKEERKKEPNTAGAKGEVLQFFNGFGGFNKSGDEYHIILKPDEATVNLIYPPAPWINVISNPDFGFIATEKGAGYTWSENSRENKLTEWSNDPVLDPHSEAFYIRDEDRNVYWSPTPGPVPGNSEYRIVHGFGYTRYENNSENLKQELIQFVSPDHSVKISLLKITNAGENERNLSLYRYLDRVMGVSRYSSSRYIIQEISDDSSAIFARNFYNNEFAGRVAYAAVAGMGDDSNLFYTTGRQAFIGRNCTLERPCALELGENLKGEIKTGSDPCAAFQIQHKLIPGETIELAFIEGEEKTKAGAEERISQYSNIRKVKDIKEKSRSLWKSRTGAVSIKTPDQSLDLLMNGWLMYQNLSCRMWARTAFYQSGGAYGFRDQLQDSMAALYYCPKLTRDQILLHAKNQFIEGDVLHWWHPPTGRGIRSKITDDRLWLPYVTDFYVRSTGDQSLLDEKTKFITARKLEENEHEIYLQPGISDESGTIYEHCCRAIDISLKFGVHGLPLIGAGDWNDGMNRVGEQGKGESVWLGFFLYEILLRFTEWAKNRKDNERSERYETEAKKLRKNLNNGGWDGEWYLRAYYDDGIPLGSSSNEECRIDAISQAWSVLSGVAPQARVEKALKAAETHLISEYDQIIRLLTPPFDRTEKNPGYIKGYIPGVRENGGQYTHGAVWLIKAMAESGLGGKAVQYLNMINPVNHALNPESVQKYRVEPYVITADIYGEAPLTGMGGWSWYTGSGGWFYRVALESILGFRLMGDSIHIDPSVSPDWTKFSIVFNLDDDKTTYNISIENPEGLQKGRLNGTHNGEPAHIDGNIAVIPIVRDEKKHVVRLTLQQKKQDQV